MSASLKMLVSFQQAGVLTKEAAVDILRQREAILSAAMEKQGGILDKLIGKAPPPPPTGFFGKLKTPGMTGGNGAERGWGDVAANMGKLLALAGLTAGTLTGAGLATDYIKLRRRDAELDKSFAEVIKHPNVQEWQAARGLSEQDVRRNFDIMARYAPSLALNPSVATSALSEVAQENGINTMATQGNVETLTRIQGMISKARKDEKGNSLLRPMDFITPSIGM